MKDTFITDDILYIGCDDTDIDLFESQYVVPNGVSYNSYLIMDEKIAVMDTADKRVSAEWFSNLENALGGKTPDYLIVSHLEPDHASNIGAFVKKYPNAKVVGNVKTFNMLPQFFGNDILSDDKKVSVKEGDTLELGKHTLQFFMAPMVHWPEVMVTYEMSEKVLFSADGFGKFGALSAEEDWACEARRYYFNIVGKYGAQVQALLKKAATLDISVICPLHGPILKENLGYYIDKYNTWSSYTPEDEGILIACASIHGNTLAAMNEFAQMLREKGAKKVVVSDLSREDMAEVIEDAFRYDKMVLAACSYDGGAFPPMEDFLNHLKSKTYRSRTVALIENGSWAPSAGRCMRAAVEGMKDIKLIEPVVTIKSVLTDNGRKQLSELADEILK